MPKSKSKARSAADSPEQHQEVDFEEEGEDDKKSTAASPASTVADDAAAGADA